MILSKKYISLFLIILLCNLNCFAADDFTHTLALAKHSACNYIAEKFDALSRFDGFGNFVLKELKKKEKGLFPWRFEVTNGYQEGFVYYALKGIALENKGDIIAAYNSYQNSLLCIDEKASFAHRNPRHEVELAIGRIYLKCGRFYDAYNIFDTVRLESHDKNILIAADTGLINRAIAIGDYKEACEMYEDLGTMTTLTREQFNGYAKTLFSLNKDRDAFAQLLYGIAKYGFSEELGFKDPLIALFYNALPRATDDEIEWYYDLLGYGIVETRARKGNENHILMLMKTRMALSAVLPFLHREDDMNKLHSRISFLKTNLIYSVSERFFKPPKAKSRNYDRQQYDKNKQTNAPIVIEDVLENALMECDFWLNKRHLGEITKTYKRFLELMTNETWNAYEHDGSTYKQIAEVCKYFVQCGTNKYRAETLTNALYELSLRSDLASDHTAIMGLFLYRIATELRHKLDISLTDAWFITYYNTAHPWLLNSFGRLARQTALNEKEKYINLYHKRAGYLPPRLWQYSLPISILHGNAEEAVDKSIKILSSFHPFKLIDPQRNGHGYHIYNAIRNLSSWATDTQLEELCRAQLLKELQVFIGNHGDPKAKFRLREAFHWKNTVVENEMEVRKMLDAQRWSEALTILTNVFADSEQPGHACDKAQAWYMLGNTNMAIKNIEKAQDFQLKIMYPLTAKDGEPQLPKTDFIIYMTNKKLINNEQTKKSNE